MAMGTAYTIGHTITGGTAYLATGCTGAYQISITITIGNTSTAGGYLAAYPITAH